MLERRDFAQVGLELLEAVGVARVGGALRLTATRATVQETASCDGSRRARAVSRFRSRSQSPWRQEIGSDGERLEGGHEICLTRFRSKADKGKPVVRRGHKATGL